MGNAVVRNKIRRKFKAEFYKNRAMLNFGMDIVIFPKKVCAEIGNDLFVNESKRAIEYLRSRNDLDHSKIA